MNNINKTIAISFFLGAPLIINAQVLSSGQVQNQFSAENVFLDASTNFDPEINFSNNIGKGLLFPRTDLTQWSFNVTLLDGFTFPTAFDGMIVYNTGTGSTPVTGNNPSVSTNVIPGFYYFSNPSGSTTITGGIWKPLGGAGGGGSVSEASTTAKGVIQLSGDLTGTAGSPSIAANAVTSAKILDGTITAADLNSMSATSGQVLKWNGTAWAPAADGGANYAGSTSVVLNGNSFERAALTGDITAAANSNITSIAANAITSDKILDGEIANIDLAAGTGGIYKGSGSLSTNTTVALQTNKLDFTSTATTGTSHFTVDGSTFNVDAVNDKIGIGTNVPSATLHVVQKTSTSPIDAMTLDVASFSTGPNADASHFFRVRDIGGGTVPFIIKGNGNVGIGAPVPETKLDIPSGEAKVGNTASYHARMGAGYLDFYNSTGVKKNDIRIGSDNNLYINSTSNSANTILNSNTGNVGIGTITPKATLDVAAKTTNGSQPEGFIAPRLTGDQIKAGDSQYGTNQTGTILYATVAVTSSTTKTANINAPGYYYFDGNVWQKIGSGTVTSVTGTAPISVATGTSTPAISIATANATTTGALSSTDWTTFNGKLGTALNSGNLFVGNASNVASGVAMSGDATISNTGVLSIGTGKVTSAHILDGTITAADLNSMSATSGQVLKYNGSVWAPAADNNTGASYTASNGVSLSGSNFTLGGNLTGATTISNITSSNTMSFKSPNDADATITVGTDSGGSGGVYFGNSNHGVRRGFATSGAGNDVGLYTTSGNVYLSSNGATIGEFILASGKVGIGTTTPHSVLQLSNVLANRKLILQEDADNDNQAYSFGVNSSSIMRYQVANTSARHAFYAGNGASSSNELMTIQGNGNVGIGTSSPGAKLQVDGNIIMNITGPSNIANITAANTFSFRSPNDADAAITVGTNGNSSGGVYFGNSAHGVKRGFPATGADNNVGLYTTAGNVYLSTNGANTGEFVLTGGKVGIGTTSPSSKLEVSGAATNASAFNADATSNNSIIDFSQSNLAYTSGNATSITLNNMKSGGAYTLVFTSTSAGGTVSFSAPGFSIVEMGTSSRTNGKKHIYSFIVVGSEVYVTMATQN